MNIAADGGQGGSLLPILLIVGLLALTYFMIIRPQNRRRRGMLQMQSSLNPGADVVTVGGLYGTVVAADEETVRLEIAPDVTVRFARAAIARVIEKSQPAESVESATGTE